MERKPAVAHELRDEIWTAWAINWSAVWVGSLATLSAALIFGLIGTALGAASFKTFSSWHSVARLDVALAVFAAFFAFAIGGWCAGKISGLRHAEPSILHAAISWAVALPLLLVLLAVGGAAAFGGWYQGLMTPIMAAPPAVAPPPEVIRGTALAAVTSILLGLVGAVIGGWIASGEPMHFTHFRTRTTRWSLTERSRLP